MSVSISILGSCVTRDAFAANSHKYNLKDYYARTSFISLAAALLPVEEADIPLESEFRKKCIWRDLSKSFWREQEQAVAEWLILDFIDKRIDLLRKESYIATDSKELAASGRDFAGWKSLKRDA